MPAFWDEIKNIKSTSRDLRNFAYIIGGIFLALGVWFYLAGRYAWQAVGGVGLALVLAGLLFPRLLTPFHKIWMALGVVLGFVITRVILVTVFFVVITPLAVVMRLLGKRPLEMEFRPKNAPGTYWHYRGTGAPPKEQLEKQF